MPNTVFSSHTNTTAKYLIAGVVVVFVSLFALGYWFFGKTPLITNPLNSTANQIDTQTASTPEEVKRNYQAAVTASLATLTDATQTTEQKNKALEDFFFSARVPQELRTAHLQSLLKTQTAVSLEQKTEIISNLLAAIQTSTSTP